MATKTAVKNKKKPVETTLGKAPTVPDFSHVRKPIDTNIFGLRQVVQLMQTSTEEVKNYITYECDIMYECKMCRTIFRSLANFILHKRNYCTDKYNPNDHTNCRNNCQQNNFHTLEENLLLTQEPTEVTSKPSSKQLEPIVDKLIEQHNVKEMTREVLSEDLSKDVPSYLKTSDGENNVCLQTIENSNSAVFQTVFKDFAGELPKIELMKNEVMEIHGILDNDEVVLGPDGKICNFKTDKSNEKPYIPKSSLVCTECNTKFSTKKTLTYHIKYKHNLTRLVYICPECKDSFANTWCVYRHLYKVHRKSSTQIRRLREQICNSAVRKDQEPNNLKTKDANKNDVHEKSDDENQWMKNIEGDNDLQMCGGCGKRFERKAALYSHSQMCTKRIAVCNTIKENHTKKEQEGKIKTKLPKLDKETTQTQALGSSKRKPLVIRTYKPLKKRPTCGDNKEQERVELALEVEKPKENYDDEDENNCSSPLRALDTESMLNIIGVATPSCQNNNNRRESEDSVCDGQEIGGTSTLSKKTMLKIIGVFPNGYDRPQENTREPDFKGYSREPTELTTVEQNEEDSSSEAAFLVQLDKKLVPERSFKQTCKEISEIVLDLPHASNEQVSIETLVRSRSPSSEESVSVVSSKGNSSSDKSDYQLKFGLFDSSPSRSKLSNYEDELVAKPQPLKRKRTLSVDHYVSDKKSVKLSLQSDVLSETNGVSFISKAAPYMNRTDLTCVPCGIKLPSFYQLLWHMSDHFSWFRFQCTRCAFMSFSKFGCVNHAKKTHLSSHSLIDGTVLPIPNWKTVLMSRDFSYIGVKFSNEDFLDEEIDTEDTESKEDKLGSSSPELFHGYSNYSESSELRGSEKKEETKEDKVKLKQSKNKKLKSPEPTCEAKHARPVRNRQKSVKVLQNDFYYDLEDVIKNNARSSKTNTKTKKTSSVNNVVNSSSSAPKKSVIRVYTKKFPANLND